MPAKFTSWRTPRQLFDPISSVVGGFAVDAAADQRNALISKWYGPGSSIGENALEVEEWLSPAWCNPPYGRGLDRWLDKFIEQAALGVHTVSLLPAYIERNWWKEKVVDAGADIIFLVGRVPFEKPCPECDGRGEDEQGIMECSVCAGTGFITGDQPRDPSALVIYGPSTTGRVGWMDWRKRAKVSGDGDPNSESRSEGSSISLDEGTAGVD